MSDYSLSMSVQSLKHYLHTQFKIKDLGPLKYFLGLGIARSIARIHICQKKYTLEILQDTRLLGAEVAATPIELNHKLSHNSDHLLEDVTTYSRLIGKLIYLNITRPDITYTVNVLSQFLDKPT